jgi:pimeloyl-ACP methyl ester carboxylesterase
MDRPRVVFVHGIRTSRTMWRAQLDALSAAGRDAVAIDLPGHGDRISESFTVDAALAAIDEEVSRTDSPVLLVGLSLGGYFSIRYAAEHPDRVAGLVAASCSSLPRRVSVGAYRALARGIHRLPDRGLALHNGMARRFVPPAGFVDLGAGGVALDVMDDGLAAAGQLDPLRDLAAYPGPVWLVNGALDHFRLDESRMLRACRDGRRVRIPGATHLASLVRPEAFTRIVVDALETVDRRLARRPEQ